MPKPVLIIEDDESVRISLKEFLEGEGNVVYAAANGRDALELLETVDPPALILLDLMMPIMDGGHFLEYRRRIPALRQIPVIIMSGWLAQRTARTATGAESVLHKPINPAALLEVVRIHCDDTNES